MSHTPGPWKVVPWKGDNPTRIVAANGNDVADIYNDADAPVIAAALELYDAAEFALRRIAEYNAGGTIETKQHMRAAQDRLYAALQKARRD